MACASRSSLSRPRRSSRRCASRSRMSNERPLSDAERPEVAHGPGRGLLFIISAPSGAGKTTLAEQLALQIPRLKLSRSYTSRPARPGEIDGVDYNFVSRERFEAMAAAGEFLEWAAVFG